MDDFKSPEPTPPPVGAPEPVAAPSPDAIPPTACPALEGGVEEPTELELLHEYVRMLRGTLAGSHAMAAVLIYKLGKYVEVTIQEINNVGRKYDLKAHVTPGKYCLELIRKSKSLLETVEPKEQETKTGQTP